MVSKIIIAVLWFICAAMVSIQFIPYCGELKRIEKFAIFTICWIAGPVFALNNICVELINSLLPEGWDNNNNENKT